MGGHLGKCVSGDFREAAQLPPMYAMVKNREQIVDGPTAAVAEHERPGHMCRGSACVELYGARARDRLKAEDYKGCAEDAGKALWLLDQLENWLASNLDFLKRAADAGADDRGKPKLTKQRSRDDSTLPSHRRRLVHRLERLGREASVGTPKGSPAGRRLMKSLSLGSAKRAYMLREQGESDEERVDEPEKAAGERRTRMRCKLLMLRAAALYYQGEKLDAVQTFEEVLRLDVDCERARGKLVALLRGADQHLLELLDASRPQVKSPEALPYGGPKTDFRDADANGDESDDEDIEEEVPTLISRCQDVIAAHKELWAPALRTLPLDVMQDLAKRKAVQDTTSNESITTFLSEGTKSLVILHNSKKKKLSREMLEQVPALVPRLEELDLTLSVPLNPATGSMSRFKVGRPEKLEFEPLLSQRFWEELHAHCRGLRRLQVCRDRCTFRSAGEWQAFTRNLATLRSFRLDGCKFETSVDPMLLLRLSPALVHLHLCNLHLPLGDDTFSQLAPNLPLLRQLEIRGCPELSDASLLAVAQHCTSLQSLVVQSHRMSGVGIKAILQACPDLVRVRLGIATIKGAFEGLPVMPHLAEISSCAKTASDMDEASLFAIAGGSCPNLTSLELYACTAATDEVTRQLAQNCPRMRKLSLGFTPTLRGVHLHLFHELRVVKLEMCERLHGPNIRDFIRANTSLEWLSIEHRDRFVQDREAVSLTEDAFDNNAEHFPNFKHLQIKSSHHWAGAQMRPFLLSSPYLETINLIDCPKIRDLPFLGLPENSLRRLTKLHLHQLGISDEGLKALSAAACRLRVIHFCKLDNITEEGLGHLVAEHGMTLRQCLLNVCPQVSKECFQAILAQATRLERLHFWGPSQWLTDEFVERELCAAPCAASLTSLHLCDCEELTLRSVKTILSALPELRSLDLTDSVPGLVKEQARELVVATGNRVQLRGGQSPWKSMARARGGRGVVRGPAAPAALEGTGAGMLVGEGEELRRGSFQAPESW